MAGIYDSNLKQLVGAYAQDFVTWLLKGATVIRELPTHLNRAIDVDSLYEVMLDGQKFIFHLEFQRSRDVDMAKRVLEYNVFASCKFALDYSYTGSSRSRKRERSRLAQKEVSDVPGHTTRLRNLPNDYARRY